MARRIRPIDVYREGLQKYALPGERFSIVGNRVVRVVKETFNSTNKERK